MDLKLTECPFCPGSYKDVFEHCRKKHKDISWTPSLASRINGVSCDCGILCRSLQGLQLHKTRYSCPSNSSEVPTIPVEEEWNSDASMSEHSIELEESSEIESPLEEPSSPNAILQEIPDFDSETLLWNKFLSLQNMKSAPSSLGKASSKYFSQAVERLCKIFLESPSDKSLVDILSLPKIGLAPAITSMKVSALKNRLTAYPNVDPPPEEMRTSSDVYDPVKACLKSIRKGKLRQGARILTEQSKVAECTPDVIESLRELHPNGSPHDSFRYNPIPYEIKIPDASIRKSIFSFPIDTSPGPCGWNAHLLRQASEIPLFLEFIRILCLAMRTNACPGRQFLTACRLIPLLKPNGSIRPIAVGSLFYRLCMKILLKSSRTIDDLLPFQLGVGTKGGVEPILRAVENASKKPEIAGIITLDFKNAFNNISRPAIAESILRHNKSAFRLAKWSYSQPSALILPNNQVLWSSEGVRQGDPLAPYLFSLAVRPILEDLKKLIGDRGDIFSYLDDVTIIVNDPEVYQDIVRFFSRNNSVGLVLNEEKSKFTTCSEINSIGLDLLGSHVGSTESTKSFLNQKIEDELIKLQMLKMLPYQERWLLLSFCLSQNLRHLQRQLSPSGLSDTWKKWDDALFACVERIRCTPYTKETDKRIFSLPIRFGGLGILSHQELNTIAYGAYSDSSDYFLNLLNDNENRTTLTIESQRSRSNKLFSEQYENLISSLSEEDQVAFVDSNNPILSSMLRMLPTAPQHRLTDDNVACILMIRTLAAPQTGLCSQCGEHYGTDHDMGCSKIKHKRAERHEDIKEIIYNHLKQVGMRVSKEPIIQTPNAELRADLRISGPAAPDGPHTLVDLSIGYSNASHKTMAWKRIQRKEPENMSAFISRRIQAALQVPFNEKMLKYEKLSKEPFLPITMSASGTLHAKFGTWLLLLQKMGIPIGTLRLLIGKVLIQARTYTLCR